MSLTDDFSLLTAQSEVWTAHEVDPGNPQFTCAGYLQLVGPFRPDLLDRAVEQVDAECEALRLRPGPLRGTGPDVLSASLSESAATAVESVDLTGTPSVADAENAARLWMADDLARPLRLGVDPLVRLALFRLTPERHLFYLRYHHLLLDGYGQILYWRRLARVYTALAAGKQPPPSPFGRLADLVDEERGYVASADFDGDRSYWLDRMAGPPARVDLGGSPDADQGVARTFGDTPIEMREVHLAAAAARGTHWSVLVIAALAAYLRGLTGREDVVIGFPMRARTTRLSLTTPAMLSNELPLRLSVPATATSAELVAQVDAAVADALRHQRYRGEDLYRALRAENGHAELPAVVANVIPFDGRLTFGDCSASVRQLSSGPVRELSMDFYGGAQDGPLGLGLSCGPTALGRSDLDAHRTRFGEFLAAFVAAPEHAPVGSLELLGREERSALETAFNDTARDYDLSGTLTALVAAQAARTPDAVAVGSGADRLTYAELLDRADRLAAHLAERGVRAGDVVGVHDVRSPELVVSLLAILRAGAAYLPLDPQSPPARQAFQVADAGVRLVLTRSTLPAPDAPATVAVDTVLPTLPAAPPPEAEVGPEDPAYVIYTSGSTGRPKGVVVPHRGIVNRLAWMRDDYGVGADDRVLQKTSYSFDVSVWEFFLPLITGARLQLLEPGAERDPELVAGAIAEHGDHRAALRAVDAGPVPPRPRRPRPGLPAPRVLQRRGPAPLHGGGVLRPLPRGGAAAQPLRSDGGVGRRDRLGVPAGQRPQGRAHRQAGRQHPRPRPRRARRAGPDRGPRRAAHRGSAGGPRVPQPARADRRAVRPRPVRRRDALPHRRPRPLARRRRAGVPRPQRPPGQGARLPDRARRDRVRTAGRTPPCGRPWWSPPARRGRAGSSATWWSTAASTATGCGRTWPGNCPRTWCPPRWCRSTRSPCCPTGRSTTAPCARSTCPRWSPRTWSRRPPRTSTCSRGVGRGARLGRLRCGGLVLRAGRRLDARHPGPDRAGAPARAHVHRRAALRRADDPRAGPAARRGRRGAGPHRAVRPGRAGRPGAAARRGRRRLPAHLDAGRHALPHLLPGELVGLPGRHQRRGARRPRPRPPCGQRARTPWPGTRSCGARWT